MKEDCFAINKKSGRPGCTALIKTDCENCKFYKSRKQALEENLRCKKRAEKMGYKYKSVFSDKDFQEIG